MFNPIFNAFIAYSICALPIHAQGTLAAASAKAGLNIGIATNSRNVADPKYAALAKSQFNMVVCENEMKFQPTELSRGKFNYSGGDQVSKFASANGMKMRGHNFIWHAQSGWAATLNGNRQEMLSVMKTHIDSVAGHFKGKILEWDVLNEITDDGNGNALRNTFWKSAIGADYVDSAFTFSHRADPIGKLYYNEYGAEGMNGKSNAVYKLAQRLIASKIPIDGIGLQCHLGNGLNAKDISSNIKRLGELGLRVSMTEIDIKNGTSADWTNLLNACLENYNCVSFVAWGLDDAVSWLGSGCNCLLYDGQLAPKPPVQALIDALGKADPAVVEKRKAFLAGTSSIGFRNPMLRPSSRQTQKGYILNAASVPVFSGGVNMSVDILGRNRPIAPASPWEMGLSILP